MAYASRSGHAKTSVRNARAHAICDRCGFRYNLIDLSWQVEWRGPILQNIRLLVCRPCYDTPQENLRTIVLPADPEPVMNARVQDFVGAETDYRSVSLPVVIDPATGIPIPSTTLRITEDCKNRTLGPFGVPVGLDQNAIMPYNGGVQKAFGVPLAVLSVTGNGTATVQVTCSEPHGLQPNNQISAEGLAVAAANGFYSVNVLGATTFTYMTYGSIANESLLTPTTRIVTALVGLPYGYEQIPKISGPPLTNVTLTVPGPPTDVIAT